MTVRHCNTGQKTLGFLGTELLTFMQNQLWQGATRAAQEHGARLVFYTAINISSSPPFNPLSKVLFDLACAKHLDGLLIWSAGVMEGMPLHSPDFLDRYHSLPLVTIGDQQYRPDLTIDNYQGVRAAVDHLIEDHGRQHIGCIRGMVGHPHADERYQGYADSLQAHGLRLNPDYVREGTFEMSMGAAAAEAALAQWLQPSAPEIDAVITANDYMALTVIEIIKAHGLRVPDDIAVVGFDDVQDAQASIPSLTTVRQPFYELGQQATEMLLAFLDGQSLPSQVVMPSQLVLRESCGCIEKPLSLANIVIKGDMEPVQDTLTSFYEGPPGQRVSLSFELKIPAGYMENLANHLQSDLYSGTAHQFLSALRLYLIEAAESDFDATVWQNAISALRRYILSASDEKNRLLAEALFDQARVLVTEEHQRACIRRRLIAGQQIENLRRTSEALITSFGKQLLVDTLYERLPALGFPSFYLSLYDNPEQPMTGSHLILAYDSDQRLDLPPDGLPFPTRQLLPASMPFWSRPTSTVVQPLYFRNGQLGLLILEVGPTEGLVYENIRAQVSSALQGSLLLRQVQNHASQLEQRVTERTEELTQTVEQLQSEVTERQRAEKSLRLTSFAVEHASDAVYWLDANARIVDVNEAACRMLGYTYEELVGGMYLHEIDRMLESDHYLEAWETVRTTGLPPLETWHHTKDGRDIPVEVITNYIAFEGQELNCAFARDITQRKQAEEALRQSEEHAREFQEKLKALQEISLQLAATESIEKLCIRAIELGREVLGYDRLGILLFENAERTKVSKFGIISTGELCVETGQSYLVEDETVVFSDSLVEQESVFVSEDTDLRDFGAVVGHGWNVNTGIWDGNTSIGRLAVDNLFEQKPLIPYQVELLKLYGLTIGHLVTRKRSEAAIRKLNDDLEQRVMERTAQLAASNQELESFAYVVSHDLKAPLRAINQLANWLGSDYAEAFDDEGQKMLDLLTKRTLRMHDLIDGILHYSRIGRVKEQKCSINLNQLVHEVVDGLDPPSHIRVSIESELPTVIGDRTRLEQVFQNLIGNSIKFMDKPEGRVTIDCQNEGQQWRFSVADNGPGIDPKYHDRIFLIFQTLNSHDKYEGTGIGLALAKKIVERWGGRIWVESAGGQGSTFFFTIPWEEFDVR